VHDARSAEKKKETLKAMYRQKGKEEKRKMQAAQKGPRPTKRRKNDSGGD
jgi:hypothetical protein